MLVVLAHQGADPVLMNVLRVVETTQGRQCPTGGAMTEIVMHLQKVSASEFLD